MKSTFKLALAAITTVGAIGSALAADYTMRLSHQLPPTHHAAKVFEQFAADVEANTGGKVDVQVFGSEQLYKASQNHAAVARGQVEAAAIINFQWGGTIPEMDVLTIPYLMSGEEQVKNFPGSEAATLLEGKLREKGVQSIAWVFDARDALFTSAKAPLVEPGDFKGVKIRGLSKLTDEGLIALGAAPVTMSGAEVYQALQTGVLDAGITSASAALSRRYYEVQKFGTSTSLYAVFYNLVVNPAWWAKLPADVRQGIEAAAAKAEKDAIPANEKVAAEAIEQLRDKGMTVVVQTPEQIEEFKQIMQPPVLEAFRKTSPDAPRLLELVNKL